MKYYIIVFSLLFTSISCTNDNENKQTQLSDSQEFRKYWFDNKAEISSYDLVQAQYGKLNKGEAVMVFVSEEFRLDKQVKLESDAEENATTVLKLNFIKKFITGIYDYSMYTSVFTPVQTNTFSATLKVTNTNQEWCGQSFLQLNYHQNGYQVLGNHILRRKFRTNTILIMLCSKMNFGQKSGYYLSNSCHKATF
jgi:hypothetical protein